jgi:methyl-accepting chemotaxis protein
MNLTVLRKIILGFAIISAMLLVTNIVSYLGLNQISDSARSVVEQKMPVQAKMLQVQTGMLSLAKESTEGFFLTDPSLLKINHQRFSGLVSETKQQFEQLSAKIAESNDTFVQGKTNAYAYLDHAEQMYENRLQQLQLEQRIADLNSAIVGYGDEASALMQDLSYMENSSANFARLLGTGANIDNKIVTINRGLKDFTKIDNLAAYLAEKENVEFGLSNTQVDVDFFNRLSQGIDTEGLVENFNAEYQNFKQGFLTDNGLFALQQKRIESLINAQEKQKLADADFQQSISFLANLFKQINDDTLEGQNNILSTVGANIWLGLSIFGLTLVLVLAVGTWVTRSIAIPLARINRSLSILSSGDLTHRARVIGDDEFATLSIAVNELSANLHHVVEQIDEKEKLLSEAVTLSVELGSKTLRQVALQREHVVQTTTNTEKVRDTSLGNLTQITHSTEQLVAVAKQGQVVADLVAKTKQQVINQAQQANLSSQIIHRLDENSKNIVGILYVIKNIAEQTNLLALNAAIEAARAGEQGRGFAVVADEVRNLATKTQASTQEIENVITTLQTDAKQAVDAMVLGSQQSDESVKMIEQVSSDVEHITHVIEQLSAINKKIAKDTQVQDQLLNSMAANLQSIVEIAQQSATSTGEANAAIGQIDALSEELKSVVAKFKL